MLMIALPGEESLESIDKVKKPEFFSRPHLRVEGGIPLPPWVAACGFDPLRADKPSTTGKWHFIKGL
jgi:hypothetical protein